MQGNRAVVVQSLLGCFGAMALVGLGAVPVAARPRGLRRPRQIVAPQASTATGTSSGGSYRLDSVVNLAGLPGMDGVGHAPSTCRPGRGVLHYHGGALIMNPDVFILFWGSQWQNDQTHIDAKASLTTLFQDLGSSGYACSWGEFAVSPGSVGQGTFQNSYVVTSSQPAAEVSDATIQSLIVAQVQAGHAPLPTANMVYVVATPQNVAVNAGGATGCGGSNFVFCGYHDSFNGPFPNPLRYAVLPFPCNSGGYTCFVDALDNAGTALQVVGSHELAETATDPDGGAVGLGGWYNDRNYDENADMCAHNGCDGEVVVGADTLSVNSLWSNLANGCVTSVSCTIPPAQCTDGLPGSCTTARGRKQPCAVEWLAQPNMKLKRSGLPSNTVKCSDGQPFCDTDGAADGQCTFSVAACLNNNDPRVTCTPSQIDDVQVLRPKITSSDPNQQATAQLILDALTTVDPSSSANVSGDTITYSPAASTADTCTSYMSIAVPTRTRGSRTVRGSRRLVLKAHTPSGTVVSRINLVCNPPLQ